MSVPIEEDPDINLSIPLKPIYEEFCCPVCFDTIKESRMTPCGHNFCKDCIEESLNRKHQCPCCNGPTTMNDIIENKLLDRLLSIVEREKEKSSKEYFDRLVNVNHQPVSNGGDEMVIENTLSPIEELFHKYMKKSLIGYQDYYKTLEMGMVEKKKIIQEKYTKKMMRYKKKNNLENVEDNPKIQDYTARCEDEIKDLESSFQTSTELLISSYNDYLSDIDPSPQFLPVNVTIKIPDKDIEIRSCRVDRTVTVVGLRKMVTEHMEKIGNPITEFTNTNIFVLYKSFYSTGDNSLKRNDGILLVDESVPVLQHNPQPNSLILLKGTLLCKSDAPKQCYKSTYKTGDRMDYFHCQDCNMKWLCTPCKEECHKGHRLQPFLQDHNSTWGCCYCFKTKKCCLFKQE